MTNWGSKVIPAGDWIDVKGTYTCGGNPVRDLRIELHNSTGNEVTYPVKGTVYFKGFPRKKANRIWSLDGRADVVWGKGDNLILAKLVDS